MADSKRVPIDIQYKKLLEALIDRRIVQAKWLEQHKKIRDALAHLYTDLPCTSDDLLKVRANKPTHDELTYFDCKHIVECLAATEEGANKNFFGQYTSPVMRSWSALVRSYETQNIFAAECARILTQNTAYEIPFLKRAVHANEKQVAENNRKILELRKSIAEYRKKLEASCASIGIKGDSFRYELQQLALELPSMFGKVARAICTDKIDQAIEYHSALQVYLHSCDPAASESSKKDAVSLDGTSNASFEFFTAIRQLRSTPEGSAEPDISGFSCVDVAESGGAIEINWDISTADSGAVVSLSGEEDVATIDWGIEMEDLATPVDLDAPVEINWDISAETPDEPIVEPVELVVGTDTPKDLSSPGQSRVELLLDSEFRAQVLNDLHELRIFFLQRRVELEAQDNIAFANQFQGTSDLLEQQSIERIDAYQCAVADAIDKLTDKRLQQLVLIKSSERYLDRHVASLEMLTKQLAKCRREIGSLEDKNADLIDATAKTHPQIDALVANTKKLKKQLESALPGLFKGYRVNIVGDINNL
ncbi:TPA: hypothetical protein N0F65_012515 [Lagenidium giganteum]|uniref:CDK5 regulatory subunit-associated protein 3 n=1 Tax=Lagenidium giganteum TaxID=4803 RepID=A0AAV2YHP1_9STRA|nr:TPA: hypothetical protein N0F65_012515 [Lagenidium giganteum]